MDLAASLSYSILLGSNVYHLVYLTIVTFLNVINFIQVFILNFLARKICRNERRYLIVIYREFLRRMDLMLSDHGGSCWGVVRWISR